MVTDHNAETGAAAVPSRNRSRADGTAGKAAARVRSRRSAPARAGAQEPVGMTVAVTGAASGIGRGLAARLVEHPRVSRVVAVDSVRGDLPGVTWRVVDVRDPSLVQRLAGCDVVVHAGVPEVRGDLPEGEVQAAVAAGARTVLTAAAAAGVGRAVLVTSAMVYGALSDNPVPLAEDAPLRAISDGGALSGLLDVEEAAGRAPRVHPGLSVTVLRPAILVGPGVDSVFTRHFEAPRLLVVKDSHPHWQFCHVDDLLTALELAALGQVSGYVTVGCEGSLTQDEVEQLTGRRSIVLPSRLAYGTAERLHRLGVTLAPASELAFTAEPWVVPSTRLRAAGWSPAYDNAQALAELVAELERKAVAGGRRFGRDATLGAAGATVAVLGTAAVVRQLRRQRRGGV